MLAGVDPTDRIRQGVIAALPADARELLPPALADAAEPATGALVAELERFLALMRDYPERPGKTLRGRLLVLAARAHGAPDDAAAQTLAEALELFQNWVLVHDDIEDDSEERRGRPALHRQVGMPLALNVGDAMHVAMWRHLLTLPQRAPLDLQAALDEFGAMIMRTAAGQHLDLAWVAQERFDVAEAEYLAMVSLKTAYYTVVSPLRLGAACAGRAPSPLLEEAGVDLGVAFQIRDDVLNLTPGAEVGKEFAGDLYEGKRTLVLAHLLGHATPAERERVVALLRRPRAAKAPEGVAEVLALIERYGSLAYAQQVAERRLERGLARLQEALAPLPGRRAAEELLGLVGSLAERVS
ncbi:MAG: polyprenyl synthetase family protein [Deinococcales bacterium]|nr:polyprenyl synthetase family protein [Deinococcales bacterium]